MRDPRYAYMQWDLPCTMAMLIVDIMKFEVSEQDFPDFMVRLPARFCSTTWASFPCTSQFFGVVDSKCPGVKTMMCESLTVA